MRCHAVDSCITKKTQHHWNPAVALGSAFFLFLILGFGVPIPETWGAEAATDFNRFPVKGMVTLIDLGSNSCIPCKMMAPVLEKIKERYQGKAEVVVIDVWKHRDQAQRFKIRAIPTQIFFNEKGDEVFRHLGFMSEKDIVLKMRELGVD